MNRNEMSDIIFDTLFGNTQFEQLDLDNLTPLYSEYGDDDNYTEDDIPTNEVEANKGIIRFGYLGEEFTLVVKQKGLDY